MIRRHGSARLISLLLVALLLLPLASCSGSGTTPTSTHADGIKSTEMAASQATAAARQPAPPSPGVALTPARVTEVVDGDTIKVSINGHIATVRIIGVDSPETKDPNKPVMCYGAEATAFTQQMVDKANGQVLLEKDVSETDQYGRLLRYVWLLQPDGKRMLNQELVKQGYAEVSTFPPDVKYQDVFLAEQQQARQAKRGLWGACSSFGAPVAPMPTATATTPPGTNGQCDPSYPTVCIKPPPPDLDCKDVPYRNFTVLPPDPHRFDSNHDGVGCESKG